MIKKIVALSFLVLQLQALDIFQAVEINDKQAVKQWLMSKQNVHVLNDQGQSLLHVAVQAGNRLLVKQLLKRKIDVNLIDQCGKTTLDYAVELRYKKISILLASKGAFCVIQSNKDYVHSIIRKHCIPWSLGLVVACFILFPGVVVAWGVTLLMAACTVKFAQIYALATLSVLGSIGSLFLLGKSCKEVCCINYL